MALRDCLLLYDMKNEIVKWQWKIFFFTGGFIAADLDKLLFLTSEEVCA